MVGEIELALPCVGKGYLLAHDNKMSIFIATGMAPSRDRSSEGDCQPRAFRPAREPNSEVRACLEIRFEGIPVSLQI